MTFDIYLNNCLIDIIEAVDYEDACLTAANLYGPDAVVSIPFEY